MKVSELEGAELDYWVARAEGYVWAKNASRRSGDSYRQPGEPEQWPIGVRCLIKPLSAKNLHSSEINWDGWLISDGTEPRGPRWDYEIPSYSANWSKAGPIIEREFMNITESRGTWSAYDGGYGLAHGTTPLVAAMRAYVASKFGDEVEEIK